MAGGPRGARESRTSTYYDTPDRTLRRHDMVLRLSKRGRRFVQTVRVNDPACSTVEAGAQWEDAVAGAAPDLGAPESGRHLAPALATEALQPLFRTVVQRTSLALSPKPGTLIAVAIDRGAIHPAASDEVAAPINEITLTLSAGDPAVPFDIALRLLETVPFRIVAMSRAERGYRLVGGVGEMPMPVVANAQPPRLKRKQPLDAALQDAARSCLGMLLRNEPAALERHPEAIHQMRIALRRLRAMLTALRPMLPREHFAWANDELRWLARALAPARGWDVFAQNLIEPVGSALTSDREIARLAAAAERHRHVAYDAARETIESQRFTATLLRLWRWLEARGWRDQPVNEKSARLVAPVASVAPDILARLHRKVLKRARRFAAQSPAERHRLRIALKKLHYAVDFLGPLYRRKDVRRFLKLLKPLQDDLGHLNDVRSAHAMIAEIRNGDLGIVGRAGGIVLGWHDRGLALAEGGMRQHVRRFRRARKFW